MADNINLIVNETIENITVNPSITNEIVDITVGGTDTIVDISVTPNLSIVNVNTVVGVVNPVTSVNGQTGDVVLDIPSIEGLATITYVNQQDALKVDKVVGKELSTNDYTTIEKNKLAGIAEGAEVNVNADWNATSGDAFILNKPTIPVISGFVPYTGAASDVNLGEFGVQLGNLEFDLTPTNAPTTVGSLSWNDSDGTLDLKLKGGNVTLQLGQETVARIVNKTATNITLSEGNYQVVRVTGAIGQRPKVDLALADNDLNSTTTLGLVTETILNNQEGFITTSGQVRGINTTGSLQGETWMDGDILYLSGTVAGRITNIKPVAPIHTVIIGFVEHAHITQGKIFVKVDNGYELDELHNVSAIAPNNNEVLTYDLATTLWKPKTVATALGYTPVNNALTISTTSPLQGGGDLSANRTLSILQSNTTTNGYLSSTDWNAFNGKQNYLNGLGFVKSTNGVISYDNSTYYLASNPNGYTTNLGTVTNVSALTLGTIGTDISSSVVNSSTTPVITLNIPTASSTNRGALSSTDWSIFNNKQNTITPASLTKVDDTNVTLTLGGSPTNALLQGVSLTLGWSGTLADSRIASASTWNAKQNALTGIGFVKSTAGVISYDTNTYLTTINGISAGGELSGTYANPSLLNSAVTNKILTGVNITGGTILSTDSMLTAFGKLQNQVNGLIGGSIYQSVWNASTNTPTLTSSVGTKGYYYIVSVDGTTNLNGIIDWKIGDWAIFNGTTWNKVDNSDSVSSVNGFTGAVSLTTANISEVTNLYYTEARVTANTNVAANTAARHNALTLGINQNGLSLSTQVLSLGLASTSTNGALTSADWTTFNNKFTLPTLTSGSVLFSNGTTIAQDNADFFWDNVNSRLGIGTITPDAKLEIRSDVVGNIGGYLNVTNKIDSATVGHSVAINMGLSSNGEDGFRFLTKSPTSYGNIPELFIQSQSNGVFSNRLIIKNDGLIGIGIDIPTEKLHVSGNLRLSGSFKDSNNLAGTYGQVLSSTETGTSWITNGGSSTGLKGIHSLVKLSSGQSTNSSVNCANNTTGSNAANTLIFNPYIPAQDLTSTSLSIYITAATASFARILIYSDLNGKPNTKLYESSALNCSTIGLKTVITTQNFVAGTTYWLATYSDVAFTSSNLTTSNSICINVNNTTSVSNNAYTLAVSFGSAPTTISTVTISSRIIPIVFINI